MSLNRSKASFFRIEKERKKHCKAYEQMRYFILLADDKKFWVRALWMIKHSLPPPSTISNLSANWEIWKLVANQRNQNRFG